MNLILILLFSPFIYAFNFNPMSQAIELGENQKSVQFFLENDTSEKMAVELSVRERKMDENGKETLPATTEMTIFPPQMVIPPNEKRTIRVSWTGSKELKEEKAFRVIAEQLPLKVDEKQKKKSGIQMLMKYMAALYVTPKDAEAKLKVLSTETRGADLVIELLNEGSKHQVLTKPTLTFKQPKVSIGPDQLTGMTGENILANSKRRFVIKKIKGTIPSGAAEIKIED